MSQCELILLGKLMASEYIRLKPNWIETLMLCYIKKRNRTFLWEYLSLARSHHLNGALFSLLDCHSGCCENVLNGGVDYCWWRRWLRSLVSNFLSHSLLPRETAMYRIINSPFRVQQVRNAGKPKNIIVDKKFPQKVVFGWISFSANHNCNMALSWEGY